MASEPLTVIRVVREIAGVWVDDGYDFMEAAATEGWRSVASWGEDGWDLGDWPYAVYLFRERVATEVGDLAAVAAATPAEQREGPPMLYEVADYCEGDIRIRAWATAADRQAAIDIEAVFHWLGDPERHGLETDLADLDRSNIEHDKIPERLRGPYRRRGETPLVPVNPEGA